MSLSVGWRVWNGLWLTAAALPALLFWLGRPAPPPGVPDATLAGHVAGMALYLAALAATGVWLSRGGRSGAIAGWAAFSASICAAVVLSETGPGPVGPLSAERAIGAVAWVWVVLTAVLNGVWIGLYSAATWLRRRWLARRPRA